MAKQAWETIVAYQMVYIKAFFFLVGPMITAYLSVCQVVDLDAKYPTMGTFARVALWVGIIYTGISNVIALWDNSPHRAKTELERKRTNGGTGFYTQNPNTGP